MTNKDLKRIEFLRLFLKEFGLTWKIDKPKYYTDIFIGYHVLFNGKHVDSHPFFYSKKLHDIDLTTVTVDNVDNLIDSELGLTNRILKSCYHGLCFKSTELKDLFMKTLPKFIKFKSGMSFFKDLNFIDNVVDNIDYVFLVQSLILEGISLDKFPDIEEVV